MKKTVLLITTTLLFITSIYAQKTDTLIVVRTKKDSSTVKARFKKLEIKLDSNGFSIYKTKDSIKIAKPVKYPTLIYGIYIEHIDFGLSTYHTGNNFNEPLGYEFLAHETWRTHTFGFDFLQMGVRMNPNFKIMLSAGVDWNHIRLKKDVTILPDKNTLTAQDETINFSKNRFSSKYLRIPLYVELRSAQNKYGKRATLVFGPEIGLLLNGKLKQKSNEDGKVKVRDSFNFEPIRYGANLRLGYGLSGLFFKYYFNDVFAKNEGPSGYKNLAFGFTFGF